MICNNLKGLFRRVGLRGRTRPVLPRFSFTMNLEGVLFGVFNKIPRFNLIKTVINSTKKVPSAPSSSANIWAGWQEG